MGKRIIRYFEKDILEKANEIVGKQALIILKNNQTIRCNILNILSTGLQYQIKFGAKNEIPFQQIQEIEIDKTTAW